MKKEIYNLQKKLENSEWEKNVLMKKFEFFKKEEGKNDWLWAKLLKIVIQLEKKNQNLTFNHQILDEKT